MGLKSLAMALSVNGMGGYDGRTTFQNILFYSGDTPLAPNCMVSSSPENDTSSDSNVTTLRRMLPKERVFEVPFVRMKFPRAVRLKKIATKLQKLLAGLLGGL